MRNAFVRELLKRAETDERIFVITPDLGFSVWEPFRERYPSRFVNAGIAEQNAVGMAAGLALSGHVVYVYSIVPFVTMRAYEQIRVDAAYMNTAVRIVGVGAGFAYGGQGPTHHGLEDVALMRALPNMTVCCPGDDIEARELTVASFDCTGPMYIRLGKSGEPRVHHPDTRIAIGEPIELLAGSQVAVLATGTALGRAREWVERLRVEEEPIEAALASVPTVKPFPAELIVEYAKRGIPIVTVEEHSVIGGLGSAAAEVLGELGAGVPLRRFGLPDAFCREVGSHSYLLERSGFHYERFKDIVRGACGQ
ncbi:transketolase [Paenibacillus cellulosilyticus]|uniref:Transketolase n=1 Tax=Paenibacillus cellulosilyticus TaxID=375489 RepID=A0A2V2YXU6_9BACL|nr:transketolase C-terminal domain-containing protein [Paenibacillus cellulosilyticus]PWW06266.1 transketolase [Paenibacillus cellulosilyticus]QKS42982.1 1-deoxy-D-xylulose-5-phosphate synthase [Paenibacillus cellulosilyticus]